MDDEKVISLTVKNVKLTVEVLLKALFMVGEAVYRVYQDSKLGDRIFQGETPWNDFMKSIDHITIKDLELNKIDLDTIKEELNKYGIGYSIYEHPNKGKVSVAYSINHKDIVDKILRGDKIFGERIFHGETEWSKFMESIDPITIRDLKTNEVNLEKFKEELAKYDIGFSFYKHSDGKTISMAFSIKHKDIVEKSLAETLEKMVKDDKFREEVKKDPKKKRDLDEKLRYYKDVEKSVINEKKSRVENVMEKKGEKRL